MGEGVIVPSTPPTPAASFQQLPLELRNMVYELLLEEAIVSPSFGNLSGWQIPTFLPASTFVVEINASRVKFCSLTLPSNLIYTCNQIHTEFSTLIFSSNHHLLLSGEFMMGLSSTAAIFDILTRRPWMAKSIHAVNIQLNSNHLLLAPFTGGAAMNTSALKRYPWLRERLKLAELSIRMVNTRDRGLQWVSKWVPHWWSKIRRMRLCEEAFRKIRISQREDAAENSQEHNALPDLAKLFGMLPSVKKIDIDTENRHLLSLFPDPRHAAESFGGLTERNVEINVLARDWDTYSFCTMLYRNGIEKGTIRCGDGSVGGRVDVSYERLLRGLEPGHHVVKFRIMGYQIAVKDVIRGDARINDKLTWWKKTGGIWLARKKKKSIATLQNK